MTKTVDIYNGKDPLELPLFTYAEVARWLKMPPSTVIDRIKASRPYGEKRKQVSFVELHKLWIRRDAREDSFVYEDDLPAVYHPAKGVSIDPRVSFGRSCIVGTGTSTGVVACRVEAGETPQDVADDYDIALELVEAAVAFERR